MKFKHYIITSLLLVNVLIVYHSFCNISAKDCINYASIFELSNENYSDVIKELSTLTNWDITTIKYNFPSMKSFIIQKRIEKIISRKGV